ncbi:MAG: DUF4136 domain-containing protein [Saprospiraceae bacterium]|nr:DUF4136 domain-containing protein [Lewinella sp.]
MRWSVVFFPAMFIFLFTACSSIKTFSDYDPGVNFKQYKTYTWSTAEQAFNKDYPQYDNSLNRMRIKKAIDAAMQERGYILQSDRSEADLQVDFHINLEQKAVPYHGDDIDEIGYGEFQRGGIYQYNEGTLIIHWVDQKRQEVVWQGVASKVLDISQIDKAEKTIQQGVQKVFAKLPI